MCSCQAHDGGAPELVKNSRGQHPYSHLPKGCRVFLTSFISPALLLESPALSRPQKARALQFLRRAALRTGRLSRAYVQLLHLSTAQHLQHVHMHTTMVSSWVLLCSECLLLLSAVCIQSIS